MFPYLVLPDADGDGSVDDVERGVREGSLESVVDDGGGDGREEVEADGRDGEGVARDHNEDEEEEVYSNHYAHKRERVYDQY